MHKISLCIRKDFTKAKQLNLEVKEKRELVFVIVELSDGG
jgi:hypothetical protein